MQYAHAAIGASDLADYIGSSVWRVVIDEDDLPFYAIEAVMEAAHQLLDVISFVERRYDD